MVALPEGLDLEATINPLWGTDRDGLDLSDDEEVDDFGRPIRRKLQEVAPSKKKKVKGTTKKGSSKKRGGEAVRDLFAYTVYSMSHCETLIPQPLLDYAGSSTPQRYDEDEEEEDDVDSIPIVKLDIDLPPRRQPTPPPRVPTPPPMLVDVDGEMPTMVATPPPRIEPVDEKVELLDQAEEPLPESKATEGTVLKVVKKKKRKEGTPSTKPKKKKSSPTSVSPPAD